MEMKLQGAQQRVQQHGIRASTGFRRGEVWKPGYRAFNRGKVEQ